MATKTPDQVAEEAKNWLASEKGEKQLTHAIQQVRKMSLDLQKARELKPESLYEPVTV